MVAGSFTGRDLAARVPMALPDPYPDSLSAIHCLGKLNNYFIKY